MEKILQKIQNWLVMTTFSKMPRFENDYKWKIYDFINDIFFPINDYTLKTIFNRNKWIFKVATIPIVILLAGVLIGSTYKETEKSKLQNRYDKVVNVANHFYSMSKHQTDSLSEIRLQMDSILCYFDTREWLEYEVYKESDIEVPTHLPDSVFFFMLSEKSRYNIPGRIFWRLVFKESSFQMIANQRTGAYGYMQVMPSTYNHYRNKVGVDSIHTPFNNIRVGTFILNEHHDKFVDMGFKNRRAWELALSAYNAGIGNVMRSGYNIPNFKETKDYVSFILRNYEET